MNDSIIPRANTLQDVIESARAERQARRDAEAARVRAEELQALEAQSELRLALDKWKHENLPAGMFAYAYHPWEGDAIPTPLKLCFDLSDHGMTPFHVRLRYSSIECSWDVQGLLPWYVTSYVAGEMRLLEYATLQDVMVAAMDQYEMKEAQA